MPKDVHIDNMTIGSDGSVQTSGGVATKLQANDMNVNALRTNDVLQYDEWKLIDSDVVRVAQERLVIIKDMVARGMVTNLPNGLASTLIQWQTENEFTPAGLSMDGLDKQRQDRPVFTTKYLPLPIIHKDFQINARNLAQSRKSGEALDTRSGRMAARVVSEKAEEIMVNGADSYEYGGGTIYGLVDFPEANSVTLDLSWTDDESDASVTGEDILNDVLTMIEAQHTARHYGPYILYIPTLYGVKLEDDFKANSDRTIRERLMAISQITAIITVDFLPDDTIVMLEATRECAEVVIGLQPTTVQWDEQGGLTHLFKVMTIMVPRIYVDQNGRCGITVGKKA